MKRMRVADEKGKVSPLFAFTLVFTLFYNYRVVRSQHQFRHRCAAALTVCQASDSSKSSDGDMRHITIHAEDEVKRSRQRTGCSVSPVPSRSSHLRKCCRGGGRGDKELVSFAKYPPVFPCKTKGFTSEKKLRVDAN